MTKSVLVIDDDSAVRKAFDLSLRGQGYELILAASGAEGLDVVKQHPVDLVYLDLRMPGMDGVQTLRALHESGFTGQVFIVTAFHREFFEDLVVVRDAGIPFELLQKPLEREQIIAITRGILENEVTVDAPGHD